ncbi:hypothetical protein ACEPAG_422 [Sanghuangporus baumii]
MASNSDSNEEPRLIPSSSSQTVAGQSSSRELTMVNTSTPPRPSLSTSLSDFALSSSSSSNSALDDSMQSKDDATPLQKRVRRPTTHSLWLGLDQRVNSPLANTFTLPSPKSRKRKGRSSDGDGDSTGEDMAGGFRDKDRMTTESSSPSSELDFTMPSLPMRFDNQRMEEAADRPKSSPMDISRSASPASALKPPADIRDTLGNSQSLPRRMSQPPKLARLLSLRAEAHPEELEVKHEAQVQRLLASFSGLPPGLGSRSRSARNRGRYPEEAVDDEEFQREETPSDDEDLEAGTLPAVFNYKVPIGSDPINITKPSTPVPTPTVLGTPEDARGGFRGISESPGNIMDIDMPLYTIGSPSVPSAMVPPQTWRQTPPPTSASSAVRTAKRKYEDRFEPYAPAVKRRAVSPSISHLKDRDIISPIVIPRSPILKPRKSFSQSQTNSTTSSPTVSNPSSYMYGSNGSPFPLPLSSNGHNRSGSSSSVVSSPTVRASMILASPILRPVPRLAAGLKRAGDEEKIVDGAGENLKELNIGRS